MKRKSLCFVIVTLVAAAASPAAAEDNLHFGFLGGLSLATATLSPAQPYELSRTARANGGGFVEYDMTQNLSLEVRAVYIQKAIQMDFSTLNLRGTASMNYLSFPVLLKTKANRVTWKPFLAVGAELAFKTNAKAVLKVNGWEQEDEDFDDGVRKADFALNFGAGIEIPRNRVAFLVEGLYSLGLLNLVAIPDEAIESVKTRTFLVNAGIRF